jgi:hypothetical protein
MKLGKSKHKKIAETRYVKKMEISRQIKDNKSKELNHMSLFSIFGM